MNKTNWEKPLYLQRKYKLDYIYASDLIKDIRENFISKADIEGKVEGMKKRMREKKPVRYWARYGFERGCDSGFNKVLKIIKN